MKNNRYIGAILEIMFFMMVTGFAISGIAERDKMYCKENPINITYLLNKIEILGLKSKYQKVTYKNQSSEYIEYLYKNEIPSKSKIINICSERMLFSSNN